MRCTFFNNGDFEAKLRRAYRTDIAARARSDDDEIVDHEISKKLAGVPKYFGLTRGMLSLKIQTA